MLRCEEPAAGEPRLVDGYRLRRRAESDRPVTEPASFEGTLMRDADLLEQLGAVGILRNVSKVGRDTRFVRFTDALSVLRQNAERLPGLLQLDSSRRLAPPRVQVLLTFLEAAETEAEGARL